MFDLGLSKIFILAIVGLIVLGPERLPKVARIAGALFGRAQRYVQTVKDEVTREMNAAELNQIKDMLNRFRVRFVRRNNKCASRGRTRTMSCSTVTVVPAWIKAWTTVRIKMLWPLRGRGERVVPVGKLNWVKHRSGTRRSNVCPNGCEPRRRACRFIGRIRNQRAYAVFFNEVGFPVCRVFPIFLTCCRA